MQNFSVTTQRVSHDWLTETVGWVATMVAVSIVVVFGYLLAAFDWPSAIAYPLLAIMALGGGIGFAVSYIRSDQRDPQRFPARSVDWLGILSLILVVGPMVVGIEASLDLVLY